MTMEIAAGTLEQVAPRRKRARLWPYYILERHDAELAMDLRRIINHFEGIGCSPDVVVFVPKAGIHLRNLFVAEFGSQYEVAMFTVRRPSSKRPPGVLRRLVYRSRPLADACRHVEVVLRVAKLSLRMGLKREVHGSIDTDVIGKRALLIDDSVDTGATARIISQKLTDAGAKEVLTSCIANQVMPRSIKVDFAVHEFALLRSPTSPDYRAH